MKANMDKTGNNGSVRGRKTWKRVILDILTWVPEKTRPFSTYFATRRGVWGYTLPVAVPAGIVVLLAARLLGAASVTGLAVPMFLVIMAENLVESRRSKGQWAAAGMRTVIVSAGFLVLARLIFLDQTDVFLLIVQAATVVAIVNMAVCLYGVPFVRILAKFLCLIFSDDREVPIPWNVAVFFDVPVFVVIGSQGYSALYGSDSSVWISLVMAVVALVCYFVFFLHDPSQDLGWLKPSGHRAISPDGGVTLGPALEAVLVEATNDSTNPDRRPDVAEEHKTMKFLKAIRKSQGYQGVYECEVCHGVLIDKEFTSSTDDMRYSPLAVSEMTCNLCDAGAPLSRKYETAMTTLSWSCIGALACNYAPNRGFPSFGWLCISASDASIGTATFEYQEVDLEAGPYAINLLTTEDSLHPRSSQRLLFDDALDGRSDLLDPKRLALEVVNRVVHDLKLQHEAGGA